MLGVLRLAVVDDHRAIALGVLAGLAPLLPLAPQCQQFLTIDDLVTSGGEFEVVVLDLHLADGRSPEENVQRLAALGCNVLIYTHEHRPAVIGRCLQAGAKAIVRKHEDWAILAEAIEVVASGEDYLNADWAVGVEAIQSGTTPHLSPREVEIIGLLAAGLPIKTLARRLDISDETIKEHLRRARRKYADAGRHAPNHTVLYLRAVEDGHLPDPSST